jgi:acyl carrier protein
VLRSRLVPADAQDPEMTLVLLATPDFDIAEACAELGQAHGDSWPPVVVLAAPGDGGTPDPDGADLRHQLAQVARAAETVALRREFLRDTAEILECAGVAEEHYFFVDAGGDSVTALRLSTAVEERFGFELPLEVLTALTVGRIADLVATSYLAVRSSRMAPATSASQSAAGSR